MQCSPKAAFGLFGSLYFSGVVISSLIFPPLADKVGRRPMVILGTGLQALASLILLYSTSLTLTYGLVFMMGIAMAPRVFPTYVLAMELLPTTKQALATTIVFCIDGLVLTWCSLYFMFIDNNWKYLYSAVVVGTFITFIATWWLPESPKFLVTKGKYQQARDVITRIARTNRIDRFDCRDDEPVQQEKKEGQLVYQCLFEDEIRANQIEYTEAQSDTGEVQEVTESQSESVKSESFGDYFKRCRNLANLMIFIYLFCGVSFSYQRWQIKTAI